MAMACTKFEGNSETPHYTRATSDTAHVAHRAIRAIRASDRFLQFFPGQGTFAVLVISLQMVNHHLRIAELYQQYPAVCEIDDKSADRKEED